MLPLHGVSVLQQIQQTVLSLDVHVHQQPMLPLDGSVLKQPVLPGRVFSTEACVVSVRILF